MVELLVEAGAAVCPTNTARKTPLHLAAMGGPRWSTAAAAEASSLPGEEEEEVGDEFSATGTAVFAVNADGGSAMVSFLVRLGAGTEAVDIHGNTPLICAAKRGNYLTVDALLRLGARITASNVRGHTALHVSAFAHQLPVVVRKRSGMTLSMKRDSAPRHREPSLYSVSSGNLCAGMQRWAS